MSPHYHFLRISASQTSFPNELELIGTSCTMYCNIMSRVHLMHRFAWIYANIDQTVLNIFHTSPYIFSLLISTNKSKRYCVEPEFDYRCSHYEFISDTTWSSLDRRSEDSINYFGLPDHRFEEAFFTTNPKGQRRLTRPLLLHVSALAHIFEFC